ncbi:MAG TPA: UDP-N-acetylmuramoyl-L-alanine--D-glutamate ligase [Beijerinckiaceae bacterium]
MTPVTTFAGKNVALFGLGGSGVATALALQAGGARVLACDDSPASIEAAREKDIETADLKTADWSRFAAFVLSPGVPLTHPEPHWSVPLARAAGVEIIGDIELFCRERAKIAPNAPFIAITGTNGKSTTTALVAHILRQLGRDVQMGGNIGTAILSLEPPANGRFHVIEMSSFQIDLTPTLHPTVGVLLNISPDHLDRHGSIENYAAIKRRLVDGAALAAVGLDDRWSAAIAEDLKIRGGRYAFFSSDRRTAPGIYAEGSKLFTGAKIGRLSKGALLADLAGIASLRGQHNAQNAAAALTALLSLSELCEAHEPVTEALHTFPGLPHRMEQVGRRGDAIFVNDSKATNADSAEKALASFEHIYWILGGKAKDGGISTLRGYFPKIEKAYLIGAATDEFAATLDGRVPYERCGTLETAVARAAEDARGSSAREPVVLLSPACASYDQYRNFEIRGDHFRDLVRALPGIEMKQ